MTFVDTLRKVRDSAATAYLLFLIQHPQFPDGVHAFFEGADDASFYMGAIRWYARDTGPIIPYTCGGKTEVYDVFEKVTQHSTSRGTVLFFVDKDWSDIIGEAYPEAACIYVTDYYSVENCLVDTQLLSIIWDDIYHLTNERERFDTVAQTFEHELDEFYTLILPITCWCICLKKKGERINYKNINLDRILSVGEGLNVTLLPGIELIGLLERMCSASTPGNYDTARLEIEDVLTRMVPKLHVRGKFELWFFIKFLGKLVAMLQEELRTSGKRIRIRTNITVSNAVEVLGPRVQLPSSLEAFLSTNLLSQS